MMISYAAEINVSLLRCDSILMKSITVKVSKHVLEIITLSSGLWLDYAPGNTLTLIVLLGLQT